MIFFSHFCIYFFFLFGFDLIMAFIWLYFCFSGQYPTFRVISTLMLELQVLLFTRYEQLIAEVNNCYVKAIQENTPRENMNMMVLSDNMFQ